jgi:hypothetical protein
VNSANAYIFTILDGSGKTIRTESLRQSFYIIKDLSVFDVGTFIWQTEAVILGNDGSVIQHGTVVPNRFTIDIPLPNDPTRHTGELYGR